MNAMHNVVQFRRRDEDNTNPFMHYLGGDMNVKKEQLIGPMLVAIFTAVLTAGMTTLGVAAVVWKNQAVIETKMNAKHQYYDAHFRTHDKEIKSLNAKIDRHHQ